MSKLNILEYPDPRLRTVARPVTEVGEHERQLAADMLETMYAANGIGLAATQVGENIRMVVMDLSEERNQPRVFINPELSQHHGVQSYEEGCLSVPEYTAEVKRAAVVHIRALDLDGQPIDELADGLLAVCIQHEIDHLDGKLFIDHLSALKRRMVDKRLRKRRLEQQEHVSA